MSLSLFLKSKKLFIGLSKSSTSLSLCNEFNGFTVDILVVIDRTRGTRSCGGSKLARVTNLTALPPPLPLQSPPLSPPPPPPLLPLLPLLPSFSILNPFSSVLSKNVMHWELQKKFAPTLTVTNVPPHPPCANAEATEASVPHALHTRLTTVASLEPVT